jgi:hypothetical protein
MLDIANSLNTSQPAAPPVGPWGAMPNNMVLAGAGRGRGAWTSSGSLPPGMAQPTVLPKIPDNCKYSLYVLSPRKNTDTTPFY